VDEPTVLALRPRSNELLAVGARAIELAASDERVQLVRPVQRGAVADSAAAQRILHHLLRPYSGGLMDRARVLVAVPSSTTRAERRAVRDAAKRAGASSVHLIEHVMAAALGADLPVHEPVGTMVVDVGAEVTEAAVLSLGCVVAGASAPVGGATIDGAIKQYLRRDYGMLVSDRTAEGVKRMAGSLRSEADGVIEARGTLVLEPGAVTAILERSEVQPALDDVIDAASSVVRECLVQAAPELGQDLISRGVHLVGGGSRLGGLVERLDAEYAIPFRVMDDPEHAVIRGAGKCLEAVDSLRRLFVGEKD